MHFNKHQRLIQSKIPLIHNPSPTLHPVVSTSKPLMVSATWQAINENKMSPSSLKKKRSDFATKLAWLSSRMGLNGSTIRKPSGKLAQRIYKPINTPVRCSQDTASLIASLDRGKFNSA